MAAPVIRVGIVEDEALMRSMLETAIDAQEGLHVTRSVAGAQEARLVFTPRTCDIAIVDVNLLDGNGVSLEPPRLP
ncbi:response regulator [Cellulosimicrobium cellulans]|uniref:response regulator n=1 Tax=Cellulosimicrobium cellulans TaxID=1710 RepID=UPI001EDC6D27|nr:response regulator [Cellulosimicrobium cellulans]UKJ64857.1 response regulator [Cellulosimicrobium cellulans]